MPQTVVKCVILQSVILHNTLFPASYNVIIRDVNWLSGSKGQHPGILDIKQNKMYLD